MATPAAFVGIVYGDSSKAAMLRRSKSTTSARLIRAGSVHGPAKMVDRPSRMALSVLGILASMLAALLPFKAPLCAAVLSGPSENPCCGTDAAGDE
jgi:hypothetical protein